MAAPYETEGEFFEQIVAGERIEGWMDALALMPSADTVMRVAGELATAAEASRAYRDGEDADEGGFEVCLFV